MSKIYVVYTINLQGKVMYVGKTCNFGVRKSNHLTQRGKWSASAIPSDIDLEEVTFNIVAKFEDEKEALTLEGELILQYDTIKNGWNKHHSGLVSKLDNYNQIRGVRYREENQDKYKKTIKKYRNTHKELISDRHQKWLDKNRDKWNAYQREYRMKKLCNH